MAGHDLKCSPTHGLDMRVKTSVNGFSHRMLDSFLVRICVLRAMTMDGYALTAPLAGFAENLVPIHSMFLVMSIHSLKQTLSLGRRVKNTSCLEWLSFS